jgi:hypothetical protein
LGDSGYQGVGLGPCVGVGREISVVVGSTVGVGVGGSLVSVSVGAAVGLRVDGIVVSTSVDIASDSLTGDEVGMAPAEHAVRINEKIIGIGNMYLSIFHS